MNKKIIGIVASVVVMLALIGVGVWHFIGRSNVETGGNRLGVEWYDINGTEFTITTTEQLYEFAELSNYYDFKNQTIKLGADIVVNEGNASEWEKNAPSRKWSPITGFGGVFDGQGHTISGLYAKGRDTALALFSNTMSGAKIQNFKLTNTYFESSGFGGVASISSNGGGKFKQIYSDAILNVVGNYSGFAGGICSKLNLQSSLEECWFDGVINTTGRDAAGIVDNVLGSRVTISHCLFSGEINSTWDYSGARTGGLVGRVYKTGAGLILEDSLSAGKINAANVYYTASVVGASMGSTSLTATDTYGSMGSYDVAIGRSGSNGTINSAPLELREQDLIGNKAYEWTNLDFDKYWALVEDDTPILKCFAEEVPSVAGLEKAFDTSWYMEGASEYVISDLKDLYGLYYLSASKTFSGKTIKLASDIAINEGKASDWAKNEPTNAWYPVSKFAGTLDGQGHTISGMYINSSSEYVGLFKQTTMDATVRNLSVKNGYIYNTSDKNVFMGTISGRGGGTFDSIYADTIIVSYGSIVGGIFGQVNAEARNSFTNCWFDGSIDMKGEAARYVGGIAAGAVKGNTTFAHCLNTASISQLDFKDAGMFVGGIAGYIINEGVIASITDCLNAGKISVNYHVCVGSVVGRLSNASVTISDTYATTESYTYSDGSFRGIGTSSNGYTGGVADLPEALLSGIGGYQWTTLNFKDYWSIVTGPDGTPILKKFANKVPNVVGIAKKIDISWYNPDKKEFVLKDLADLYGFYIVSGMDTFEGKTVKLEADITVNAGNAADWATNVPANTWFPIKKFAGTFDGQGHTIDGVYLKTNSAYAGLFSQTTNTSTIKNLKLTNSYFESTVTEVAAFGSIAGQMGGIIDTVYSNAIVVGYGKQIGGLVGRVNQSAMSEYRMTECWFDGSVTVTADVAQKAYIGGLVGVNVQGILKMDNCLNTGKISYIYDELPLRDNGEIWGIGVHVGGLVGGVMNGVRKDNKEGLTSEVYITDCISATRVISGLKDGTKVANGAGTVFGWTDKGTVILDHVYAASYADENPNTVSRLYSSHKEQATIKGSAIEQDKRTLLGTKGYAYTTLDFVQYWSAREEDVPALKIFVGEGLNLANAWRIDTDWKGAGTKADPYIISTVGEFFGFAQEVNGGNDFAGKHIELGADIDANKGWTAGKNEPENIWTPIGNLSNPFKGSFDGKMHTIKGIYVDSAESYVGLFGYAQECSIRNFYLKNSYFSCTAKETYMGSILGRGEGTFANIYSEAIINSTGSQLGGLIGRVQRGNDNKVGPSTVCTLTNCWFNGTINASYGATIYAGGLTGNTVYGQTTIDNCLFTGEMNIKYTGQAKTVNFLVGGLAPQNNGTTGKLTITNSLSAGAINITQDGTTNIKRIGSAIGYCRKGSEYTNVYAITDYCVVVGEIEDGATNTITPIKKDNLLGVKAYQMTRLDFDSNTGTWSARQGDVPALKTFVGEGLDITGVAKIDTSWVDEAAGTAVDPYLIEDMQDLYGFSVLVNGGNTFEGKTIKLVNTIDLNEGWTANATAPENVWEPIGSCTHINNKTGNYFAGTFDGNNKTIKGLYVNSSSGSAGLFGYTVDSTIRDLTIENSYMATRFDCLGTVVGYGEGILDNIQVHSDVSLVSNSIQVGGIIGRVQDGTVSGSTASKEAAKCYISNCSFAGRIESSIESGNAYVGGLVGYVVYGTTSIANSLYSGSIICEAAADRVGGILGSDNGSSTSVTITNSVAAGTLTGGNIAGSVIGLVRATTSADSSVYTGITGPTYGTDPERTDGANVTNISVVDFTTTGKLDETITVLNANVIANNKIAVNVDWRSWLVQDGIPVLGDYPVIPDEPDEPIIDMTPDTDWEGEGTQANPYKITTPGELYGLAQSVNNGTSYDGQFFVLTKKIILNNGLAENWASVPPTNSWTSIGKSDTKPFQGTFDGQGFEIEGIYMDVTSGYMGLFGYGGANSTIKNLRVENSYFKGAQGNNGSIVGHTQGSVDSVYSNATVIGGNQNTGGIIGGFSGANKSITNCWFAGSVSSSAIYVGGVVGRIAEGTTTIANCLNTGSVTSTLSSDNKAFAGGIVGGINKSTSMTCYVYNCVNTGQVNATNINVINAIGSVVGRTRNTTTIQNVYTTTEPVNTAGGTISTKSGVVGVGNYSTNDNSVTGAATEIDFAEAGKLADTLLALNTKANANVGWDNWVPRDGKPVLEQFAPTLTTIDVTPDKSWLNEGTGTEEDPYILIDAADLYGFAQATQNSNGNKNKFSGKIIKLGANITVNNGNAADWAITAPANASWTPIGTNGYKFSGIFDGNGCSISGIYLKTTITYGGLFGYTQCNSETDKSTVKNLRLLNSYFEYTGSDARMGSIAGAGPGNFSNIYSDAIMVSNGLYVGGIVGSADRNDTSINNFDNCWFNGTIIMKGDNGMYAGGIVGVAMKGEANISNCLNTGSISSERTAGVNVGGIVGCAHNDVKLNITNCVNAGAFTVLSDVCVGAIVSRTGIATKKTATVTVKNSYMTGDSYTKYDIGTNGTGQTGAGHEISTYVADTTTIITSLNTNNNATVWTAKTVNGKTIPVPVLLQDLAE